ncbi:MAG: hypothetical protein ABEH38_02175 [Flavobacteriales bacterium]
MRESLLTSLLALFLIPIVTGQSGKKLVLEGKYHNKNLYVNNPMSEAGVGFCVNEVRVNGDVTSDEVNSSAFEVNLEQHELSSGDKVLVEIDHKAGCKPKVLNPDVLKPRATFKVKEIEVDSAGILHWTTVNEKGKLPFKIQQFKWNKWVTVGEVQGKGTPGKHRYSFETIPVPGRNRFRVKQEGMDGEAKSSPAAEYHSTKKEISYEHKKSEEKVVFSRKTSFELYNMYGELVKKGFGKELNISNFDKGTYYMNYGSKTVEFNKK